VGAFPKAGITSIYSISELEI